MSGVSLMDRDPSLRDIVAEGYVEGLTNQQIADKLGRGVHKDTITDYKRHPAVVAIADRLTKERHLQITSKIDSALLKRLEHVDKIDTETLLKIRKEILPERVEIDDKRKREDVVGELFDLAGEDPELAERLMAAQEKAAAKSA